MNKHSMCLAVLISGIVAFSIIPAYAEVTSLKTNAQFYKGGSTIYFSGTVLDTDPPNVTVLIFNPGGQFVMLTSGIADSNHKFQISVDTSNPDNQQKLSVKGTYNATAFIANKESGKTVSFVFSPDGSPVAPFPPTFLTTSTVSSTEIDLRWSAPVNTGGTTLSGYKIERDDGTGFNQVQNVQSTSYQDTGLVPNKLYSYRVSSVNTAGTSDPSNVATAVTLSPPAQTQPPAQTAGSAPDQSTTSLADLLKKRLEDAKRLQELLNAKTPSPAAAPQTVTLDENTAVGDMAASLATPKPDTVPENNLVPSGGNFNLVYPAISLAGVGLVVGILYMRKKQRPVKSITAKKGTPMPAEIPSDVPSEKQDEDYAMMILKNRLAKGEITLDQFKEIKDELSEP